MVRFLLRSLAGSVVLLCIGSLREPLYLGVLLSMFVVAAWREKRMVLRAET